MAEKEACTQWCLSLSSAVQSQNAMALKALSTPNMVLDTLTEEAQSFLPPALHDALFEQNANVLKCAQALQTDPGNSDVFSDFLKLSATFMQTLSNVEQLIFQEEAGYDLETKLKNAAQMDKELAIEMERLSRGGPEFSLALALIDDFDLIKEHDSAKADEAIKMAAKAMLECLRPFDDAYYVDENEFVICLKQTQVSGGLRAFERLEEYLDETTLSYNADGKQKKVTMSCCVSEPVADDDLSIHLQNLREDTKSIDKSQGAAAFTFQELSPLQRYMKT
jgi:diguanylate cyclase (GGDEF)-like protein